MHIAAQDHETCEIVAASSVEQVAEAWRNAGMVPRRTDPIFCYDPRDLLKPGTLLDLNLADGDQCFLSDPVAPYLC
jgi:hypothetical protein